MIPQSERVLGAAQPVVEAVRAPDAAASGAAAPSGAGRPEAALPAGAPAAASRAPTGEGQRTASGARRNPLRSPAGRLSLHFGLVLLAASATAALLGGAGWGISAALGVSLAGANLLLMRKITAVLVEASGAAAAWALALPFKLGALVGLAYALVASGVARPVPLAMGFALLPLTGVFLPRASSVPDLKPSPRPLRAAGDPVERSPGSSPTH